MKVQAATTPVGEHGRFWIMAAGVRIGDGVPKVRTEPAEVKSSDWLRHHFARYAAIPDLRVVPTTEREA